MLRISLAIWLVVALAMNVYAQGEAKYEGKTVKEWVALLKHKDSFERQNAAYALGQMKIQAKEAVPALIEALKDDKAAHVRAEVADALGRLGYSARDAMPALIEATRKDMDVAVRAAAT